MPPVPPPEPPLAPEAFRTERLLLRPARQSDLDALHAIFSDPRAMRYWDRPANKNTDQTQAFLTHFMTGDRSWREEYILDLDGVCIGKAGMWKKAEVGFIIAPSHWRQGYAYEAMAAILPRIWDRFPQLPHLTAELDPRNAASVALLTKLGFHWVRTEEKNFLYGEEEWCDTAYYSCPRP